MNRALGLLVLVTCAAKALMGQAAPFQIITSSPLPNATVGVPYSTTIVAANGFTPYFWDVLGTLPAGLGASTSGANLVISGTPSVATTASFDVQVSDSQERTARKSFTLTVLPASSVFSITTESPLREGTVGQSYTLQLTAANGSPPFSWSVPSGTVPPGLSLLSNGFLGGTPTTAGTFDFTVRAIDAQSQVTQKNFRLTVIPPVNPLTITTTSLATGAPGSVYNQTLSATGGVPPYSWSASLSSLPPGITFSTNGVLSGTPTTAGDYRITFVVTDSAASANRASTTLTLRVVNAPPAIVTASPLPAARLNEQYSLTFQGTGGSPPYTFNVATGPLPPGLSLLSSGVLTGSPTQAGTFSFSIGLLDSAQLTATKQFSLTVGGVLTITTEILRTAAVSAAYSQTLAATGGTPPYTWSITGGTLPAGLTLNTQTGEISGTPTATANTQIAVTVRDQANQTATKNFTVLVAAALTITTASPLPAITPGSPAQITLAATGGTAPYTWSITGGALPAGLTLNPATGAITGSTTAAGAFSFEATVTDVNRDTARRQFTGTVGSIRITKTSLADAVLGAAYRDVLTAEGGTQPLTWTISSGSLPEGLRLNAATGEITGTPTRAGAVSFSATVTDNVRLTATQALRINVGLPPVSGVTINAPDTPQPAQQPAVGLTLTSTYPVDIDGTVTITFAPDAVVSADDPAIQFSTGGRQANFTVRAGTTQAAFSTPNLMLQTGTVAGTITLTTTLRAGGAAVACNCPLTRQIRIPRSAPVIQSVRVNRVQNGFNILIIGFSTSRELTSATFRFTGNNLQGTEFTVPMTAPFTTWFQSGASAQFGSQFLLTQPFTLQGDSNAVTQVSVTLTNASGASAAMTANF